MDLSSSFFLNVSIYSYIYQSTVLAASNMFQWVVFSFVSMYSVCFICDFFYDHWLFKNALFSFYILMGFPIFILIDFQLCSTVLREDTSSFQSFYLLDLLYSLIYGIPRRMFHEHLGMSHALLVGGVLYRCLLVLNGLRFYSSPLVPC